MVVRMLICKKWTTQFIVNELILKNYLQVSRNRFSHDDINILLFIHATHTHTYTSFPF